MAGLSLVAMECLSDFGTVSFFSVSTLTTGIYNSWLAFDDLIQPINYHLFLLLINIVLFLLENYSRGGAKYHQPITGFSKIPKLNLKEQNPYSNIFLFIIFY